MNSSSVIIGISGKMGSGKDFIASKIKQYLATTKSAQSIQLAFADALKMEAIHNHGLDFKQAFPDSGQERSSDTRQLLQSIGRQARDKDPLYWTKIMDSTVRLHKSRGVEAFVISDVRFENEAKWIKANRGIIIRVNAPDRTRQRALIEAKNNLELADKIQADSSETALDEWEWDHIVDNSADSLGCNDSITGILRHMVGVM